MSPDPQSRRVGPVPDATSSRQTGPDVGRGVDRVNVLDQVQRVILALLGLGLVVALVSGPHADTRYALLVAGLIVATGVAWRLGSSGHYRAAAVMTVLVTLCPPWLSVFWDAPSSPSDFSTMAYAVMPLMLSAMLLGVRAVLVVAACQAAGFALVIALAPNSGYNWLRLLLMILAVALVSITYAAVSEADLRRLDAANRRLRELHEILRHESRHDPLTGLYNRRYLEERLLGEISRAHRGRTGLNLVLFDIDRFKTVNDKRGHVAGDEALVSVSAILSRDLRASDIACRFGGDEFLVVLAGSDLAGAVLRADRLRAEVQDSRADRSRTPLTLSAGVAGYPEHGTTFEDLLHAADMALYTAKSTGRNRVCVATVGVPPGGSDLSGVEG